MVNYKKVLHIIFSYETPKIVAIRSLTIGILSRFVQLVILSYIVGYVLVYNKGYQEFSTVQSSVTTKVKGVAFTNFSDSEFSNGTVNKDLYRRIWDVADYVVPASENNAVFIATNVLLTADQKQGICPEDPDVHGALCDPENNTCVAGESVPTGNGIMTGECVPSPRRGHTCQIHAWCPVENDNLPLGLHKAVLSASKNFTILIKNFVEFPKFPHSRRRNIKESSDKYYLQKCHYDPISNPDCPIFGVGDIVEAAIEGKSYEEVAVKGAIIAIIIEWDCNFDWDKNHCFPTYSFKRLDDPDAKLAPGWNFRYAQYYEDDKRTLFKLYGIKFSIIVQGQAGRFSFIPLLLNIGAGLGLFAVQVVICDLIVFNIVKKRHYYKSKKFEDVVIDVDGDDRDEFVAAPQVTADPVKDYGDDKYQRLVD